ncbi:hypothetical protein M5689_018995 [Euphorbia peplus]|nr:hypothetical protein M5689_018995 [Euphorbia peplus]
MAEQLREEFQKEMDDMKKQLSGVQELKDQVALLAKLFIEKNTKPEGPKPETSGSSKDGDHDSGGKNDNSDDKKRQPEDKNENFKYRPEFEVPDLDEMKIDEDRLEMLEERLRSVLGSYDVVDARALCLVPDVVMPHKFRTPDFEKFTGLTCPKDHLTMYCRKMGSYASDDKILIQVFQESLQGAALRWYMQLERVHIRKWKDLADAFIRQYKHNTDLAPTREDLRVTLKEKGSNFQGVCHDVAR